MKDRLTSSGLPSLTLALTNCRRMPSIASRSVAPSAFAISCSPSSGSGWSMENPCDESLIRGAAAAVVGSVAAIVFGMARLGAVFMSRLPRAFSSEVDTGSREENASKQESRASVLIPSEPKMLWHARGKRARFGHAQAIVRRAEPVQFQSWVRIAGPQSQPTRPLLRGPTGVTGLRDDEGMPLICPTCQVAVRATAAACTFAWGCFRYFGSAHPGSPDLVNAVGNMVRPSRRRRCSSGWCRRRCRRRRRRGRRGRCHQARACA